MSHGEDSYTSSGEHKFWYNSASGEVERGLLSPAVDRIGPFDTAEEAANALETVRKRSEAWAVEEAIDDDWQSASEGKQ